MAEPPRFVPVPVAELVPHEPPMLLVDELLEWCPERARVRATIRAGGPFVSGGRMPATILLEYMAQAIAVAEGMAERQGGAKQGGAKRDEHAVGLLLGTRDLELRVDALAVGDRLDLRVVREASDGKLARYACTAHRADDLRDEPLALASITVMITSADELKS